MHFITRFNGVYAFGYNSAEVNHLDKIWGTLSTLSADGPGRFWARSCRSESETKNFCDV